MAIQEEKNRQDFSKEIQELIKYTSLMTFSEKIQELMKIHSLTQAEFAKKINASPASVSAWVRKEKVPAADKAVMISNIFHVSLDWLFSQSKPEDETQNSIVTMSEFFIAAMLIADKSRLVTINGGEVTADIAKDLGYSRNTPYNANHIIPYAEIKIWDSEFVAQFFQDWKSLRSLYMKEDIPEDMYSLWIKKKLQEFKERPSPTVKTDNEINNPFPF